MTHQSDYIGRHRKEDPPTIPQKIIRFINESYRPVDDPEELFTHQQRLHRRKK